MPRKRRLSRQVEMLTRSAEISAFRASMSLRIDEPRNRCTCEGVYRLVRFTSFLRAVVEGTNLSLELLEVRVMVRPMRGPRLLRRLQKGVDARRNVRTRATVPRRTSRTACYSSDETTQPRRDV